MAAEVVDGSVVIKTKVDDTGINQTNNALKSLKATAKDTAQSVGEAGANFLKTAAQIETLADAQATVANATDEATKSLEEEYAELLKAGTAISDAQREMERRAGINDWSDEVDAINRAANAESNYADISGYINEYMREREAQYQDEIALINQKARAIQIARIAANAMAEAETIISGAMEEASASTQDFSRSVQSVLRFNVKGAFGYIGDGIRRLATFAGDAARRMYNLGKTTQQTNGSFNFSLKNILKYGLGIRSLFVLFNRLRSAITESLGELAKRSPRLATSINNLKSALNTLKGSLATAFEPIVTAIEPALTSLIHMLSQAISYVGAFFAAITGRGTYYVANDALTNTAKNAANAAASMEDAAKAGRDMQRQLAGFDNLNILSSNQSGGGGGSGGSGGGGSGATAIPFTETPVVSGLIEFTNAIQSAINDTVSKIGLILSAAPLVIGALLTFTGANIGLGLGLMAAGAVGLASVIVANWDGISNNIKTIIAALEAALSGGLAVGAVLAFSGGNIGLGIGLMIGALTSGYGSVTLAWDTLKDNVGEGISAIMGIIGGATAGIGAVLAFAGHPGIGLAMILAGVSTAAISINWNYIKEQLQGPIGDLVGLISGETLVLGILALLAGAVPVGLGLILAGTAGLASVVAANWDNLIDIGAQAINAVKKGWESIKSLAVTAWVSLKKKVSEWATDVWDFLQNTGSIIGKAITATFSAIGNWAGAAWDAVKAGAEIIGKAVTATFSAIGSWAGSAWETVKAGAEIIGKAVTATFSAIGRWAGAAWDTIKAGAEIIGKAVTATFSAIGSWAGAAWNTVKAGAEIIGKTVTATFSAIGSWAGSAWETVKTGAEIIGKTVTATFSAIGSWAGAAWDTVKAGAEIIGKTVTAGMEVLSSWVSSIADFILGPESSAKRATITATMAEWAKGVCEFLADPAQALKDMILNLKIKVFDKIWDGVTSIWDLILSGGGEPTGTTWGDNLEIEIPPIEAPVELTMPDEEPRKLAGRVLARWDGLDEATRTLAFIGKIDSTVNEVKNEFQEKWNKVDALKRRLGFSGEVETEPKNVAKDFKNSWNGYDQNKRKLGFFGFINTSATYGIPIKDVVAGFKNSWNKYDQNKRKLGFFGKFAKPAADASSAAATFLEKFNNLQEDKRSAGFLSKLIKGWSGTPQHWLGLDNLTISISAAVSATRESISSLAQQIYSSIVWWSSRNDAGALQFRGANMSALSNLNYSMPALATGTVMPYDVAAQVARTGAEIQATLDENNAALINAVNAAVTAQTSALVAAINRAITSNGNGRQLNAQAIINQINDRARMMGNSPLLGV